MQISEFPEKIYLATIALQALDEQITRQKRAMESIELDADHAIAFAGNLNNDAKRKVFRSQWLDENRDYQAALEVLQQLQAQRWQTAANLKLLKNQFSVAKLEAKAAIADKLIAAESREIVGM